MRETRVSRVLNIQYPIIQGPFGGGLSSVKLLSIVSNMGGLGSFGAHHLTSEDIESLDREIRTQTQKPYALNLWVSDHDRDGLHLSKSAFEETYVALKPFFDELGLERPEYPERFGQKFSEQIESILKVRPPVFSFVFGIPDKAILNECKKRSILTIGTAVTLDEAIALDEAGVDLIVATGFEAGGHRVSFLKEAEDSLYGLMALIPQVVDHVKAPVIAAGGLVDRRSADAALVLGAEGVQIGTAFLATEESNAGSLHRSVLFSKDAKDTGLTRAFSGRLARGVKNKFMLEMENQRDKIAPYPAQNWFTSKLKRAAIEKGRIDLMSLWCGQGAALLKHHSAAEVMNSLIS